MGFYVRLGVRYLVGSRAEVGNLGIVENYDGTGA